MLEDVRRFVGASLLAFVVTGLAFADDFPAPTNTEKSATAPMAPDEVVKTAKLPPGFRLSVVAAGQAQS